MNNKQNNFEHKENPIEILKIKNIDLNGNGLSNTADGREIMVPFALFGETVKAEIIETRNENDRWAEIVDVKKKNDNRNERPICAHFGTCGGCSLQHMRDDYYKEYKRANVIKILEEYKVNINEKVVTDPIIFGPGKRRRINFTARVLRDETFVMGFSRKNRRSLFDVHECKVTVDAFQPLFGAFRELLSDIMEKGEKLHIFLTDTENGVDVFIGGIKYHYDDALKQRFINLAKEYSLSRLILKQKNKRETVWQKDSNNPPYVKFAGYNVAVAANAFLQASVDADETLAKLVCENIPEGAEKVADLFCGRGTLTFPIIADDSLAKNIKKVDAFECDEHALLAFDQALSSSHNNDSDEKQKQINKISIHNRNLFVSPLSAKEIDTYDFICLDPPRAGCKEQVEEIIKSVKNIQTIVYVSCSNESFARDANILMNCGGFDLVKLYPVDQFLWTPHIEIVGVFKRKL